MTSTPQELAERVIAAFKENLRPEIRDRISESEYQSLGLMVREAISDSMADVLEHFEEMLKTVRAGIERPPIDL